jgi:hypothetical protein
MGKVVAVGGVVFAVVFLGLYSLWGVTFANEAEIALRLRAGGETVHTIVVSRVHEVHTRGTRRSRTTETVIQLVVEGTLANGRTFSNSVNVSDEIYAAQPEGSVLDVVVSPGNPEEFMTLADLTAREASGHHPGEPMMQLTGSLGFGAVAALIAVVITVRRQRR